MKIFLSIASYSDPVLGFTLARALATARRPEKLHFGVVDQSPAGTLAPNPDALRPARLSYLRIDPVYARGACWARAVAMSLYDGESWFLQLDSHMDFDLHWDERLIEQASGLLPGRRGVVLSAYPNAFVFEGDRAVRRLSTSKVLTHVVKPNASFEPDHLLLGFEAHPLDMDVPVPGFHLGAGCLFAPGQFAQAFPYDPWFYFHGEEQSLAARLYTHGWDIFHPPGLPVYHLYNTPDAGAARRPLHWDETQDAQRQQTWWTFEQRARFRLNALLRNEPLGVYSLGSVRTMADYAAFSGIDYASKTLSERAFSAAAAASRSTA